MIEIDAYFPPVKSADAQITGGVLWIGPVHFHLLTTPKGKWVGEVYGAWHLGEDRLERGSISLAPTSPCCAAKLRGTGANYVSCLTCGTIFAGEESQAGEWVYAADSVVFYDLGLQTSVETLLSLNPLETEIATSALCDEAQEAGSALMLRVLKRERARMVQYGVSGTGVVKHE